MRPSGPRPHRAAINRQLQQETEVRRPRVEVERPVEELPDHP